ncbi:hypothetical protein FSP39_013708 [Pinctada imbricata]|uniref:CARD domain-containing protein n=1 Tax=Pinctada imbricata TaxID=66713 RepID=A0AA88XWU1_PINIB|nr:hypothetical protein FSP39_013708 [Pinctada imbricata]
MKSFILRTDASDKGIGAILLQEKDGNKFPIAYASKTLLQREQNYSVIERECLAIVWAVMKFQSYLYGQEFLLETDHAPLVYLRRSKLGNSRLMRYMDPENKLKIQKNWKFLTDNVGDICPLLDFLFEKEVIEFDDKQRVEHEITDRDKVNRLLSIIITKRGSYEVFQKFLSENSQFIVEQLESTQIDEEEIRNGMEAFYM